jgi:hypothetical protein
MNWLWVFPAVTILAVLVMALHLGLIHVRRARCKHSDVRLVRQQRGELLYAAHVCIGCQKTFGDRT